MRLAVKAFRGAVKNYRRKPLLSTDPLWRTKLHFGLLTVKRGILAGRIRSWSAIILLLVVSADCTLMEIGRADVQSAPLD